MSVRRSAASMLVKFVWMVAFLYVILWLMTNMDKVGPVKAAKGMSTSLEIIQIHKSLENYKVLNGEYPQDFQKFMKENFTSLLKDPTVDSWGNPYMFKLEPGDKYVVLSGGADEILFNEDDFFVVQELN